MIYAAILLISITLAHRASFLPHSDLTAFQGSAPCNKQIIGRNNDPSDDRFHAWKLTGLGGKGCQVITRLTSNDTDFDSAVSILDSSAQILGSVSAEWTIRDDTTYFIQLKASNTYSYHISCTKSCGDSKVRRLQSASLSDSDSIDATDFTATGVTEVDDDDDESDSSVLGLVSSDESDDDDDDVTAFTATEVDSVSADSVSVDSDEVTTFTATDVDSVSVDSDDVAGLLDSVSDDSDDTDVTTFTATEVDSVSADSVSVDSDEVTTFTATEVDSVSVDSDDVAGLLDDSGSVSVDDDDVTTFTATEVDSISDDSVSVDSDEVTAFTATEVESISADSASVDSGDDVTTILEEILAALNGESSSEEVVTTAPLAAVTTVTDAVTEAIEDVSVESESEESADDALVADNKALDGSLDHKSSDGDNYEIVVSLSDRALENLWGIFAVFVAVNVTVWWCWKCKDSKKVQRFDDDLPSKSNPLP